MPSVKLILRVKNSGSELGKVMATHTPKFDAAMAKIFAELKPHDRICRECKNSFGIASEDIEFFHTFQVPPPTLCPSCRMQRRMGHRMNFLPIFHKKKCSAPGHNEITISQFSENNPVKVYDNSYFNSDNWEALDFGRDYDTQKSFFKQLHEFWLAIPQQTIFRDPASVNCEYTMGGLASKNCYYLVTPYRSENVYYGRLAGYSKDCVDVVGVVNSELCYQGMGLDQCFNCNFCYESTNCVDSWFLFDCHNCSNCFASVNLRNKKYYFFNQPLGQEAYEQKIKEMRLGRRTELRKLEIEFEKIADSAIRKNLHQIRSRNSFGSELKDCVNGFYVFEVLGGCENVRYTASVEKMKDVLDVFGGADAAMIYEASSVAYTSKVKFSLMVRHSSELEYCKECRNCEYCFGCFGLKNKNHCILNKQYTPEEYWPKVDEIKIKMLKEGEYGEFFPLTISSFPYNETSAPQEFPLPKDKVIKNGWSWSEEDTEVLDLVKMNSLSPGETPDDIKEVEDDILDKVIICAETQKPFKITKFELEFYRKKNLPIPVVHPPQRIKKLFEWRRPYKLYQYPCSKCGQKMYTSYAPEKKFKIYCEQCYQSEVV